MMRRLWCWLIGKPYKRDLLMEKRRAAKPLGIRTQSIQEIVRDWEDQLEAEEPQGRSSGL